MPSPTSTSRSCTRSGAGNSRSTACRSEEHTSELQSRLHLVCRLLLEKKKNKYLSNPLFYSSHLTPSHFVTTRSTPIPSLKLPVMLSSTSPDLSSFLYRISAKRTAKA